MPVIDGQPGTYQLARRVKYRQMRGLIFSQKSRNLGEGLNTSSALR